jgi:hypothetical protein
MQAEVVVVVEAPLSPKEVRDLTRLEAVVQRAEQAAFEADLALHEINRRRLYRAEFKTFDAYLAARLPDVSRRTAYEMLAVADVVENLRSVQDSEQKVRTSHIPVPANRHQAKQLANLETPELQRKCWAEAVSTAPKGKVTANHVAATVERLTFRPPDAEPGETSEVLLDLLAKLPPDERHRILESQQAPPEELEEDEKPSKPDPLARWEIAVETIQRQAEKHSPAEKEIAKKAGELRNLIARRRTAKGDS